MNMDREISELVATQELELLGNEQKPEIALFMAELFANPVWNVLNLRSRRLVCKFMFESVELMEKLDE